jgi:hypothetical protein
MPEKINLVFPVGTVCAACHEIIKVPGIPTTQTEHWHALREAFERHKQEKHGSSEDASQAAAPIVREATLER